MYDKLKGTVEEYNNNVWLDLMYLYWIIKKDDDKMGVDIQLRTEMKGGICSQSKKTEPFITINRKAKFSRHDQEYYGESFRISNDELLNIEFWDE